MHVLPWVCSLGLVIGTVAAQSATEEYQELLRGGRADLLRGDLLAAETKFEELYEILDEDQVEPDNRFLILAEVGLQTVELRRGNYEKVLEQLQKRLPREAANQREVVLLRSVARRSLGAYEAAAKELQELLERDPGDCEVRHRLAEILHDDGQRKFAKKLWTQNAEGESREGDAIQLAYQARSLFRLGGRQNLERASQLLVQSMSLAPDRPEARTTYGELKLAAYGEAMGFQSGEKDLKKVLANNGENEAALLAMYRLRSANMALNGGKTEGFLNRLLDRNPRCVEALVLRASNVLDDRRFEAAAEMLDQILAINKNHRVTLCHRATVALLQNDLDSFRRFQERALRGDSGWAECDRIIGDHLSRLYRFADSLPYYEAALAAEPENVDAMHGMAKALIYAGESDRAYKLLSKAKDLHKGLNDPWRHNALAVQQLLDEQYDTVEHGPFTMRLHQSDRDVLRAYLLPIHIEAVEELGKKYGWQPEGQTTVEVFRTWDDFSVRTIGFRGFTALGACFGRLITLVSPVDFDLRKQDFMWEATAWHEYTHVLTLGVSNHRVPRWLTEGFSVYEERQRDTSWERGMQRELFDAFHNKDIPPIRLMNRLFRGPRILFGYYQGGLIVELIDKKFGFDKALELLRGFGDDLGLEATFQRALGMSSRRFDGLLLEYIEQDLLRNMRLVPQFDDAAMSRRMIAARRDASDLQARIDLAWGSLQRQNPVDAGRWLAEVLRADPNNAQGLLVRAEMLRRRQKFEAAVDHYRRGFAGGAEDFDSRIRFGRVLQKLDDPQGAIDQWQRAKACWPTCTEQASSPELLLAKLYRDRGDVTQAQMEMRAYCRRTARAFAPRYTLAEFEKQSGNREAELQLLVECNRIDPFYRELHVRMGEAYEALGKRAKAALEYEVGAAVIPSADRGYMQNGASAPADDSPQELQSRGELWLRAARLRHRIGDAERRDSLLTRVLQEAPETDAAATAEELQREWRGR